MINDTGYDQDDRTVLLDRQGHQVVSGPLTDFARPPQIEALEQRMIYAARLSPAESFGVSLNPLVAAACRLLSEVVRLKHNCAPEDLTVLNGKLAEWVKVFEARAVHSGMESSEVSLAGYLLCTVADEAVVTTSWGNESQWSKMSLLSSFHNETRGGERFFEMLDFCSKNPVKHLPMLELMYLCLSLGFQGKYRVQPRGTVEVEAIRDALFRQIRQLRGDVPRGVSPHWEGRTDHRDGVVRMVPGWMVLLFTLVCLVVMYSGFAWVLGEQRDTVLRPYQLLAPPAVQPQSQP